MKVWLDDIRKPPFGHDWAKTAAEAIAFLETGAVTHISLDHDLAPDHYVLQPGSEPTGLAVVDWMVEHQSFPESIHVHTMNPVGAHRMMTTLLRHVPESTTVTRIFL